MNQIMSVRLYSFVVAIIAAVFFALDSLAAEGNPVYGKKIYENKCASCHGIKGDGNSPMSKHVKPVPSNFISREYKDSHGKNPKEYSNAEMKDILMFGMKGTAMVGFADSLKEQEIEDVLSYIRSLHEDNKISYVD